MGRVALIAVLALSGCNVAWLQAAGYDAACYYASFPEGWASGDPQARYHTNYPPANYTAFQDCNGSHPRDFGPEPPIEEEAPSDRWAGRLVPYRSLPPESTG